MGCDLTNEKLRQFFAERPSLPARGVSREAGISSSLMSKMLKDEDDKNFKTLTVKTSEKLKPVLIKYGFEI